MESDEVKRFCANSICEKAQKNQGKLKPARMPGNA